jgi:nucleoside-diphosphate-sugar epimerase
MHIFVTGGTGLTGPLVVSELIGAGHGVTGLARSDASAAKLQALGAAPHRGSLEDLDALRAGAAAADGVLHMAFGGDFADPDDLIRRDRNAVEALGEPLREGAPFVMTSGTFAMHAGSVSHEGDAPDGGSIAFFRIPGEEACLAFAQRGVRSSVVRLAPTVHGPGDYGFIAMLIMAARRTGVSAYIGDGANRWPAIHRADAATLFRLALEKAPAGGIAFHGADESSRSRPGRSRPNRRPHTSKPRSWPSPTLPTRPPPTLKRASCSDGSPRIRRCWRTCRPGTTSTSPSLPRRRRPGDDAPKMGGESHRRRHQPGRNANASCSRPRAGRRSRLSRSSNFPAGSDRPG